MKSICFALLLSCIFHCSSGQTPLSYYLPKDIQYDSSVPTPASIIGHEVGDWHISHDKLAAYMRVLARSSNRVSIETIGHTFERRPQVLMTITSPKNLKNIATLKAEHLKISDPEVSKNLDLKKMPAVVYLGYSIHGNEPSGSNASLLAAYHLAAAKGDEIDSLLDNVIVLLDPSLNPDGLQRFSGWVNSRRSQHLSTDPNNIEQNETWPNGRTNHYWFDLNRDWLPVQLPESQARIKAFHQWKPNILTDHHEMGTNSTYFFQPGIPSRNNPLIPKNTYQLTQKIAEYHAEALDGIGSLYYSKESFDDYYIGKGSSYPDINGAVGILFEQASSRSHAQESIHGVITFPFTIKNHFTTTLSSLKAAKDLRLPLLEHQRSFYIEAMEEAEKSEEKAYVFGSHNDLKRLRFFTDILDRHQIKVYQTARPIRIQGETFSKEQSFVVPMAQKQFRLIKAMFETRTAFQDSLFYDVSTWTLPLAFGLSYEALNNKTYTSGILGDPLSEVPYPKGQLLAAAGQGDTYAYAFEWDEHDAPKALYTLQKKGLIIKVATRPFTTALGTSLNRGTILIPVKLQKMSPEKLMVQMNELIEKHTLTLHTIYSGYSTGVNLGSQRFIALKQPKVMVLTGQGISPYEAGQVWHLLDQRMAMPVSLVDLHRFNSIDPSKYTTIVMVNGNYNTLHQSKLKTWLKNGGTLIAIKNAGSWLSKNGMSKAKYKKNSSDSLLQTTTYEDIPKKLGAERIGGSIFNAKMDLSHPLAFGYERENIALFRNSTLFMERSKTAANNPILYTENPLISGYISKRNLRKLQNTAAIHVSSYGKGRVISFSDDPNFRAFWLGTNKLFINSIFFGSIIAPESGK